MSRRLLLYTALMWPGPEKGSIRPMRLAAIRLHSSINPHLDDQGLTTPVAIGTATGLPPSVAVRLLTCRQ